MKVATFNINNVNRHTGRRVSRINAPRAPEPKVRACG
jgi:hypothetical protein